MGDARAKAEAEAQRVLDRVLGHLAPEPKTPAQPVEPKARKVYTKSVPREIRNGGHRPGSDVPIMAIRSMYKDGQRIAEISRELDLHTDTVRNALKWAGVWKPASTSGPRPLDVCKNGHPFAKFGRPVKGGGRYCLMCKSEKGALDYQRKKAERDG